VVGCCGKGNELSCFRNCGEFLDQLRTCCVHKKESGPRS
jgi:hypothetical protein